MSTQVKHRRGTTAENAAFTGAAGEIIFTTDGKRAAVHDGATAGGFTLPNTVDVQNNTMKYGTVGGTADAITLTHTIPRTAHTAGAEIIFKPTANNTTAVTVAVDSIGGTKALEKTVAGTSTALSADDLRNGVVARAIYDGTRYQLQGTSASIVVRRQVFTASGTYTPNANMLYCDAITVGGGGGGGATGGSNQSAGGGGGGGAAIKVISKATIGASQTVTIGAAGAAGSSGSGSAGGTGGTTSLGAIISATGGTGGAGSTATGTRGDGGVGSGGDANFAGQVGVQPYSGGITNWSSGIGGSSACGYGGGGKAGYSTPVGSAATGYGAGGGGAGSGGVANGGVGTGGIVIITEYCSQ